MGRWHRAAFAIVDAATDRLLGAVTRFGPDGHQATLASGSHRRGSRGWFPSLRLVADWTFATTAAIRLDTFIMVQRGVKSDGGAGRFRREGVLRLGPAHDVPVDCVVHSRIRGD